MRHERLAGAPWDASYADGPAPWDLGYPQPAASTLTSWSRMPSIRWSIASLQPEQCVARFAPQGVPGWLAKVDRV